MPRDQIRVSVVKGAAERCHQANGKGRQAGGSGDKLCIIFCIYDKTRVETISCLYFSFDVTT